MINIFYWAEGVINKMGDKSEPSPNMRNLVWNQDYTPN
jgi:hypothetical protein